MKIAFVGEKDMVYPMKAIGADVYPVEEMKDALSIMRDVLSKDYGIVFYSEELHSKIRDLIEEYREKPYPALVPLPGVTGSKGIGIELLKEIMKKAAGITLGGEE